MQLGLFDHEFVMVFLDELYIYIYIRCNPSRGSVAEGKKNSSRVQPSKSPGVQLRPSRSGLAAAVSGASGSYSYNWRGNLHGGTQKMNGFIMENQSKSQVDNWVCSHFRKLTPIRAGDISIFLYDPQIWLGIAHISSNEVLYRVNSCR